MPIDLAIRQAIQDNFKIFEDLGPHELNIVAEILHPRKFKPGEHILKEGSLSEAMFLILKGNVRLEKTIDGIQCSVWDMAEGEFFGDMSLFDKLPRFASVIAGANVKILIIFRAELDDLFEKHPQIGLRIMKSLYRMTSIRFRQVASLFSLELSGETEITMPISV